MDIKKVKKLKAGSKLKINGIKYIVSKGFDQASADIKEWKLLDEEGKEYLLQLISKEVYLWIWELNPKTKKILIDDDHWIFVESLTC